MFERTLHKLKQLLHPSAKEYNRANKSTLPEVSSHNTPADITAAQSDLWRVTIRNIYDSSGRLTGDSFIHVAPVNRRRRLVQEFSIPQLACQ